MTSEKVVESNSHKLVLVLKPKLFIIINLPGMNFLLFDEKGLWYKIITLFYINKT